MQQVEQAAANEHKSPRLSRYLPTLILLVILALGAYLRLSGLDWDEGAHLHPDERFLTLVEGALQPVNSLGEYFNTETSTLNPNNVGYTFFVYGTLPIFIIRYLAEWLGSTGYGEVYLVGRAMSALFDLVSIFLIYMIGRRLYRERVGLLAAAFSAFSVLLIQHAHFFVVDPFANTFILAGFYFAVRVLDRGKLFDYAVFGLFLGMAVASKISAVPLAGLGALAAGVRVLKADPQERTDAINRGLAGLSLAAFISLLTFRLFQPYAFTGPSFFGIRLNPKWLSTMAEVRRQTSGEVDFPPALQWANRTPLLFSWRNMVLWGMGLPLGLTAWLGWAGAAIQIIRRKNWSRHALPVAWVLVFFGWQASGFTQAMRYQLPVYPPLAMLAAWALWRAWDWAKDQRLRQAVLVRAAVGAVGTAILLYTMSYAFGFVRVYTEPMTRVEASRWIYNHVPAAVNLVVDTDRGELLEPLSVPTDMVLQAGSPQLISFSSEYDGEAQAVLTPFLRSLSDQAEQHTLQFRLYEEGNRQVLASGQFAGSIPANGDTKLELPLEPTVTVRAGGHYQLEISLQGAPALQMDGQPALVVQTNEGERLSSIPVIEEDYVLRPGGPQVLTFPARITGMAAGIRLAHAEALTELPIQLKVTLRDPAQDSVLAQGIKSILSPAELTTPLAIPFEQVVDLSERDYQIQLEIVQQGALAVTGSTIVHETSWDDPLPQRLDGYDIGGRYPSENLQLYWPDDEDKDNNGTSDKLERIVSSLTEGDYLFISSNRQYGTIARVPSRYPLTTTFYRALFDCPAPQEVIKCGAQAEVGSMDSDIGYQLVQVFQTHPRILGIPLNDQLAEESFTVYDHPKVLIFKKTAEFDPQQLRALLAEVDLDNIQHLSPKELSTGSQSLTLKLPAERWRRMQASGTFSQLFPPDNPLNQSQILAVVVWWLIITLMGIIVFPLVASAFPGLRDGGYAIARAVGLLFFAWLAWLLGSAGLAITRGSLWLILLGIGITFGTYGWRNRRQLIEKARQAKREIIFIELLALILFVLDLAIRFGNPDLWHPSKGGEKPMDLSYLQAVLKSPTFPPFDPWFAGGYINYYYFGFVIVGLPLKLLGIDPAIGYNLIIPTLFALAGLAAYSAASHLVTPLQDRFGSRWPRLAGLAAALSLVLLGNLGTARMIFEALQRVAGSGGAGTNILVDSWLAVKGFFQLLFAEGRLNIPLDAWYWEPSRAIPPGPGEPGPITEFPFFTFLYADLHAHMISLPFTVLTLVWGISTLRAAVGQFRLSLRKTIPVIFIGGLLVGVLRPTNTWDFPVYLILAGLAAALAGWLQQAEDPNWRRGLRAGLWLAGLVLLSFLLFQPYTRWYGQGYTEAQLWQGSKTPIAAYLTVYGLFLFVILIWFLRESYSWMVKTPLVVLVEQRKRLPWLIGAIIVIGVATIASAVAGYFSTLVVMPFMVWAGLLFLRSQPLAKRIVLFLIGTALALTLVVEVVVLRGDIGRMNTVFKFYMQVWTLFSIAGAAVVAMIWRDLERWPLAPQAFWRVGFTLLVIAAALYPLTATPAKVRDRMSSLAPASLDGSIYMQYAQRSELGERFELDEDYRAIHWLQANVSGSPVIVEANIPEYRWGTRFTIYTGLPNVLGWNWHQRQQRVLSGADEVARRASQITDFYVTQSVQEAEEFIEEYDVQFVLVGRLERIYYGSVEPCFPVGDAAENVTCDLGGRPVGMQVPQVTSDACQPRDESSPEAGLRCPTFGLDKFDLMVELGILEVAFETGQTRVYRVVADA